MVYVESGIDDDTIRELARRGHEVKLGKGSFGGYQAIWYDAEKDVYYGATESRKDGIAIGY